MKNKHILYIWKVLKVPIKIKCKNHPWLYLPTTAIFSLGASSPEKEELFGKKDNKGNDQTLIGAFVIVWWLDLQLPRQSVPVTTEVESLNSTHGEVYSIQFYVIKFVSNLRQVVCFLPFPPPVKLTATEILMKVASNT